MIEQLRFVVLCEYTNIPLCSSSYTISLQRVSFSLHFYKIIIVILFMNSSKQSYVCVVKNLILLFLIIALTICIIYQFEKYSVISTSVCHYWSDLNLVKNSWLHYFGKLNLFKSVDMGKWNCKEHFYPNRAEFCFSVLVVNFKCIIQILRS